jgi:hypothetical protein
MENTDLLWAGIYMHRALVWVNVPDQPRTCSAILMQLALHLRCSIPCTQHFYGKVRRQRKNRLSGEFAIGEVVPGEERDIREAYQAGGQPQGCICSEYDAQVVHIEKILKTLDEYDCQTRFIVTHWFLHQYSVYQLTQALLPVKMG